MAVIDMGYNKVGTLSLYTIPLTTLLTSGIKSFILSVSQSVSCLGSKHLLNECPLLGTVVHILVGSCSKDIDNKLEEVELNMTMIKVYSFSMAALTNYHKVRDLTQIYSLIFLVVRSLKLFYKVKN